MSNVKETLGLERLDLFNQYDKVDAKIVQLEIFAARADAERRYEIKLQIAELNKLLHEIDAEIEGTR